MPKYKIISSLNVAESSTAQYCIECKTDLGQYIKLADEQRNILFFKTYRQAGEYLKKIMNDMTKHNEVSLKKSDNT